ncbi:hypothetical protein [Chitinivorax sp. B]|uniref:post-PEP-CTERM-1 domain-containing protein n=1 Tax=Chitinivorax sp. B TaxID=2502235 RepID=UPI0010F960B1|nr:hypothetical protein [Chitinivorax sp. B]
MKPITTIGIAVLAGGLLVATPAFATEDASTNESQLKVYRDPVTGKLREAEHDEPSKPAARSKRSIQPLAAPAAVIEPQARRTRSGGTAVKLGEEHMNYSVAVRKADGSIDTHCVEGKAAADTLRQNGTVVSKQVEETSHDH